MSQVKSSQAVSHQNIDLTPHLCSVHQPRISSHPVCVTLIIYQFFVYILQDVVMTEVKHLKWKKREKSRLSPDHKCAGIFFLNSSTFCLFLTHLSTLMCFKSCTLQVASLPFLFWLNSLFLSGHNAVLMFWLNTTRWGLGKHDALGLKMHFLVTTIIDGDGPGVLENIQRCDSYCGRPLGRLVAFSNKRPALKQSEVEHKTRWKERDLQRVPAVFSRRRRSDVAESFQRRLWSGA